MNLGMNVMKAVTMAHSAVYDKLTNKNVTLLNIRTAAFGNSGERKRQREKQTDVSFVFKCIIQNVLILIISVIVN